MYLNIGQKILASFGVIILIMIGLQAYNLDNSARMREVARGIIDNDLAALHLIRQIGNLRRDMRAQVERSWVLYLLARDRGNAADDSHLAVQHQWEITRRQAMAKTDELIDFATHREQEADSESDALLWTEIKQNTQDRREAMQSIQATVQRLFEAMARDDVAGARPLLSVLDELRDDVSGVADLVSQVSVNAKLEVGTIYSQVLRASIIAALIAISLGILIGYQLYRSISRPLAGFVSFIQQVGSGDLTQKTSNTGRDELGRIGQYLNGMVDGLAAVATQIRAAVGSLTAQTTQLQASAQQQVSSTSEQSAAVQQISSTLDEITQLGTQVAERAKSVAATAEATSTAGRAGIEAVTETSRITGAISQQAEAVAGTIVAMTEKTQSIGDIIATVNDIAERSDLLALNAAIEASSAGEYGQSFAVVAEEMKNLAGQAKEATVQVRSLLQDIQQGINASVMQAEEAVKRADAGQAQTQEAQRVIESLVESVEQSVNTFQQIIAATNQQQIGVEQVAQAIQSIQTASEQLTAGTRDLERSATSLSELGGQLRVSVERYVV